MTNEKNLTPELLEKAKTVTSATALLTLAQENGIALTAEQAATCFAQLHPEIGALSDEELDNVSGGCADDGDKTPEFSFIFCKDNYSCTWCSKSLDHHGRGSSCSQDPLDCSTCNNFKQGQCILKTY